MDELPRNLFIGLTCASVLLLFSFLSGFRYFLEISYPITELSWPILLLLAAILPSARYEDMATSYKHISRALAVIIFIYIAMQFPFYPVINDGIYVSFLTNAVIWGIVLVITVLVWWRPIWLIASGAYLPWVKALAGHASGFPYGNLIDIVPLYQVAMFCGVIAMVFGALDSMHRRSNLPNYASLFQLANIGTPKDYRVFTITTSASLVFMVIAFHCGTYFAAGVAKASLEGGFLFWPFVNELKNIYFAGVINQQMLWLDFPAIVPIYTSIMEYLGRPMSIVIFFGQLVVLFAFSSKRFIIGLLLFYDVMHVGIFLTQGANFFTWASVNIAIIISIKALPSNYFGFKAMLASALLIALTKTAFGYFYLVPKLGWYDSKAVNNGYYVANLDSGKSVRVPTAFFTFYSYPISHMSYGHPEGKYVPTGPNGSTKSTSIYDKTKTCDFSDSEMISLHRYKWNADAVSNFIREYHLLAERWMTDGPTIWLNAYWHHFWSPLSIHREFERISLSSVTDYTLVVESTCFKSVEQRPIGNIINTTYWTVSIH